MLQASDLAQPFTWRLRVSWGLGQGIVREEVQELSGDLRRMHEMDRHEFSSLKGFHTNTAFL